MLSTTAQVRWAQRLAELGEFTSGDVTLLVPTLSGPGQCACVAGGLLAALGAAGIVERTGPTSWRVTPRGRRIATGHEQPQALGSIPIHVDPLGHRWGVIGGDVAAIQDGPRYVPIVGVGTPRPLPPRTPRALGATSAPPMTNRELAMWVRRVVQPVDLAGIGVVRERVRRMPG